MIIAKDWVVQQTLARLRRELEAEDKEFQGKLAEARKREESWKRAKKGRVVKRPVSRLMLIDINSYSTHRFRESWLKNHRIATMKLDFFQKRIRVAEMKVKRCTYPLRYAH
jgi:hypothetical protein